MCLKSYAWIAQTNCNPSNILLSNKGVVSDDDIIAASNKIDYYKGKMDSIKIENIKDKCINYWWDRRDWESEHNNSEIEPIYLDPKSREKLQLCLASVEANKEVQDLLHPKGVFEEPISMNEAALFMDVKAEHEGKETILKLKGKLDNFTIDTETNEVVLNDLKTTGHLSLIHISEPTRQAEISYAVFCLKKKKKNQNT